MKDLNQWASEKFWRAAVIGFITTVVSHAAVALLIVPHAMYSGGTTGLSQLIRTILITYTPLEMGRYDFAGIINFLISAPFGFLVWKKIGGTFVKHSMLNLVIGSITLSVIPIPEVPPVADPLLSAVLAGVIVGYTQGKMLSYGSCPAGGASFVGLLLSNRNRNIKVGQVSTFISAFVYIVSAVLFDLNLAVISMVYIFVATNLQDAFHDQTQTCGALIFCKSDPSVLIRYIVEDLKRDTTYWDATGGYTQEPTTILYVVLTRAELLKLERFAKEQGLQTFISIQNGLKIQGQFSSHL